MVSLSDMSGIFILQLALSFIVGSGIITLLTFLAERVDKKTAGVVITFPTTLALGFFFLGWAVSPEAVANVVPATLIPLGLAILFPALYAYISSFFSRYIDSKAIQILITFILSIGVWFAIAVPVVVYELNDLLIGVVGYFLLITLSHVLLHRREYEKPVTLEYTSFQKIIRSIFVGFIVFLVVLFGKLLSPFWGAIFAMFPAALTSFVIILHWYYGSSSIFGTMQKIATGSFSLFVYAIITMFIFPAVGFVLGTVLAYLGSLAVSLVTLRLQNR
jgi:MFS family permease